MMKRIIILTSIFVSNLYSCAQNIPQDYEGNWVGNFPDKQSFNFTVSLESLDNNYYRLVVANKKTLIDRRLQSKSKNQIDLRLDTNLNIRLFSPTNKNEIKGFINSGPIYYHVVLEFNKKTNSYKGKWNPFMFDKGLMSDAFALYVENLNDGSKAAYPIFSDQRFRGCYAKDFQLKGQILSFKDSNTGFNFKAHLLESKIELEFLLMNALVTKIDLTYSKEDIPLGNTNAPKNQNTNTPRSLGDDWQVSNINKFNIDGDKLKELIDGINLKEFGNIHSVLIAKRNKLVFETYFDGSNANIPHTMMSGSKSISSAIIGIAIDGKVIKNVDEKLYDFIPIEYQNTKSTLKSKISIENLLTMSSGLDVNNLAYEEHYQQSNNWLKTVLEAPVIKEPGAYADYGSANPFLLGIILNERLDMPLEVYIDDNFFSPLEITNYTMNTDDTGVIPYFGGGFHLTSRDMLKFGQLYLNGGVWNGKQIISEYWVEESFKKHVQLQDRDKVDYGYLWWHDTYTVNEKSFESIEARGSGGQRIFIIPELETTVVITAGNFRNRKSYLSGKIFEDYILPALLK